MFKQRILIVEDELIAAQYVYDLLTSRRYTIAGMTDHFEEAVEIFRARQPDLILCDIRLKGDKNGIELIRHLKPLGTFKFIYLTAYNDEALLMRAAETKPDAFLLKPYTDQQLLTTLKMTLMESGLLSDEVQYKIELFQELTDREKEIVAMLASGKNSKQIGQELGISSHTVDTHRRRILQKSDMENTMQLIVFAIEHHLL